MVKRLLASQRSIDTSVADHGQRRLKMQWIAIAILFVLFAPAAGAHTAMPTLVLVSFDQPGAIDVKVDIDLTLLLGSPENYYALVTQPQEQQQEAIRYLVPQLLDALQLKAGTQRVPLEYRSFVAAQASRSEYLDSSTSKHSTFRFAGKLPAVRDPLRLVVPMGANVTYPIAYTVQIPS
jgi:hypothetical protein